MTKKANKIKSSIIKHTSNPMRVKPKELEIVLSMKLEIWFLIVFFSSSLHYLSNKSKTKIELVNLLLW